VSASSLVSASASNHRAGVEEEEGLFKADAVNEEVMEEEGTATNLRGEVSGASKFLLEEMLSVFSRRHVFFCIFCRRKTSATILLGHKQTRKSSLCVRTPVRDSRAPSESVHYFE